MKSILALIAVSASIGLATAKLSTRPDNWSSIKSNIKYVIYVMMENRSFDNIAGFWDFHPDIDNLRSIEYCNEYTHPNYTVYGVPLNICARPIEGEVPLADPDHSFAGVTYEIFRKYHPTKDDKPNMGGFIEIQTSKYNETPGEASFVINTLDEKKTSTLVDIAKNFAFFDSYFAEHPGSTGPNRMFATGGSACGKVDTGPTISSGFFNNRTGDDCVTSVFESLSAKNISWKNYYESDWIDGWQWKWVQDNAVDKLVHGDEFYRDLEQGTLPQFSYISTECCTVDSMHPMSNPAAGQQMLKHMYDSVRNSKYWENTLIVINFDEHGGFADHVPTPTNIPAPEDGLIFNGSSDGINVTFDYTRIGVRVPAFLISPYISPNTLIHDEGTMYANNSLYTHSSVLHFLQELWDLEGLNNRVQWAKTFEYVFQKEMRHDTPKNLTTPVWYGGSTGPQPEPYYLLNQDFSYYQAICDIGNQFMGLCTPQK